MNNVFTKEWTVFEGMENGDAAWGFSEKIYASAIRGDFRKVGVEQFFSILKNQIRNEYGLVDICPGIPTDRETRVALWYVPTYTTIAMYVWFKNNNPEVFTEAFNRDMSELMEVAFKHGIVGHGYDGYEMFYKTMLIFSKAGTKEFIEREPGFSPAFTKVMIEGIAQLEDALAISKEMKDDYYFGWRPKRNDLSLVVNAWNGRPHAIFVYGTLMAGERASYMLDSYEYCDVFCLKDYAMYNVSSYPGIKKKKGECVIGEVYFVDDACIDRMDAYEGEGTLYLRECVKVENEWGNLEVFVYVYNHESIGPIVRNKWNVKPGDEIWYACYGSNLSADRFRLYIEGGYFELTGRSYSGCRNKELWKDTDFRSFPGRLYFGNNSGTWFNTGVAFYEQKNDYRTYMRLYKITWEQLLDLQTQEGASANWYGKRICLGIHEDGCPIYTITSETKRKENKPHELYIQLMKEALIEECGVEAKMVKRYLGR